MNIYSPERKAAVIAKMLPPHNLSINEVARQEGIRESMKNPGAITEWPTIWG
ncbi:TPA: hypothetical protein N3Z72_005269 [Salmonella enterica subsp. enterica serovar 6,14:y:1,7]|nr:hypothetical protein [Salmonella enterica subsp. enterica serovar 6,14:y:1,7]